MNYAVVHVHNQHVNMSADCGNRFSTATEVCRNLAKTTLGRDLTTEEAHAIDCGELYVVVDQDNEHTFAVCDLEPLVVADQDI